MPHVYQKVEGGTFYVRFRIDGSVPPALELDFSDGKNV